MTENKRPYPSWVLEEGSGKWNPPIPKPSTENVAMRWNEFYQRWDLSKKVYPSWTLKDINEHGETIWAAPVKYPPYVEGLVCIWDEENQIWQQRNSLV